MLNLNANTDGKPSLLTLRVLLAVVSGNTGFFKLLGVARLMFISHLLLETLPSQPECGPNRQQKITERSRLISKFTCMS